MVGKTSRRKQVVQAIERDDSHVNLDTDKLFADVDRDVLEALPEWMQWITDLGGAASATEQIRLVQQGKKKVRAMLLKSDVSTSVLQAVLAVVLRLYLQPQYFSFHIALDWTTSLLKELLVTHSSQVRPLVLRVSLETLSQAKAEVRNHDDNDFLASLLPWQSAFSSIVLIDRDLDFLTDEDLRELLAMLSQHLTSLHALDAGAQTAVDLVKHTACCADSLRNVSNLLKTHLEAIRLCSWGSDYVSALKRQAAAFLCSAHSPKDCLSAAAAVYLLSRHVLESSDDKIVEIMSDVVAQRLPNDLSELSAISQCALVKEGVALFAALLWTQPALPAQCLQLILQVSEDASSSAVQLFALQSLEAWLAALRRVHGRLEPAAARHCLRVLCGAWAHPARQVNHIVPDIFSRVVAVLAEQGECEEAIAEALRMPGQHRGRYQALRVLLDKLGPAAITALRPNLVADLLQAMREREVAASVASLLQALLSPTDRPQLLRALTSRDACLRSHTADYLLPHLVALPWCAPGGLVADLAARLQDHEAAEEAEARLGLLAGLVAVLLAAKTAGLATGPLPVARLQEACCVADATVRGNALVACVHSHKTSQSLSGEELAVLRPALRFSLKSVEADDCMKIQRAVRALLLRCAARPLAPSAEGDVALHDVVAWLVSEAVDGVYPGATFDREFACLSVLDALASTPPSARAAGGDPLGHPDVTPALLASFLSNWDRSRSLASALLARVPAPWPGYASPAAVQPLLVYARDMAQSARLRESDAGAQLLCNLFRSYCLGLGWALDVDVDVDVDGGCGEAADRRDGLAAAPAFLQSLLGRIRRSLSTLATLFDALGGGTTAAAAQVLAGLDASFPLAHGLVHALRLCLSAARPAPAEAAQWRPVLAASHAVALHALDVAMKVVAEAASDVPFAPPGSQSGGGGGKGPVHLSMAASYVNTNTLAVSAEDAAKAQRGVVAAWLLVKESSALLAALVEAGVLPGDVHAEPAASAGLLTAPEVQQAGEALLAALGRLKHMGAIAEAHVALQAVASRLVALGDGHAALAALPGQWLDGLLRRLTAREQVFILRRSAGYAFSFLSLLRAEPGNSPPVLLHRAVAALLRVAARGLVHDTQEDGEDVWKLAVHALNVLRAVFLDASFTADLAAFLAETLQLALRGFLSAHWAIRNSSMMLFSAVVARCITKEKNDRTTANALLAGDFFARHAALLPFLAETLRSQAGRPSPGDGDGEGEGEGVVYPILLLLAKFRPPLEEPPASPVAAALAATASEVARCLAHPRHLIRSAAARATTSLVAVVSLPGLLGRTLASLGEDGAAPRAVNATHGGLLLCLDAVEQLAAQQRAGLDPSSGLFADTLAALRAPSFRAVIEAAVHRLLPRTQPVCPPVAHVLVQVLSRLRALAVDVDASLTFAVYKSLADLLGLRGVGQSVALAPREARLREPWAPALARQAVAAFYALARGEAADDVRGHLLPYTAAFLRCAVTEVREGAYAGLRDVLDGPGGGGGGGAGLRQYLLLLAEQLDREDQPAALDSLAALLQCVAGHVREAGEGGREGGAADEVAAAVASAAGGAVLRRDLDRPRACTPALLDVFSLGVARREAAARRAWFEAVRRAAHEDQPADLRLAAAHALRGAGLLARRQAAGGGGAAPPRGGEEEAGEEEAGEEEADLAQDQLLLAFDLLQDDDEDVRDSANQLLCSLAAAATNAIVTTVEATLEVWPRLFAAELARRVTGRGVQKLVDRLVCGAGDFALARRILEGTEGPRSVKVFEAEQANLFREEARACLALCRALAPLDRAALGAALQGSDAADWLSEALRLLAAVPASLSSVHALTRLNSAEVHRALFVAAHFAAACRGVAGAVGAAVEDLRAQVATLAPQTMQQMHPALRCVLLELQQAPQC